MLNDRNRSYLELVLKVAAASLPVIISWLKRGR